MSYFGATQASTVANPPRQLIAGMASPQAAQSSSVLTTQGSTGNLANPSGQGGGLWYYCSTNLTTDIVASNFFSDGYYLGMRAGDTVIGAQFSSAGSTVTTFVGSIISVSTAGASLSTGSVMTSTFA